MNQPPAVKAPGGRFVGASRRLDETPRTPETRHGQEARRMMPDDRVPEVRALEIDWSEVVRRCMAGESGAWAELVRSHHRRVYALCYRFTGNGADAEDLTRTSS